MRIWSLHPRLLDRQGLVACWRETLLAQKVLNGKTTGYRNHPQLQRFRQQPDPLGAINAYLDSIADEADARGYNFDRTRILNNARAKNKIPVTDGQLAFEWKHLLAKVQQRSPEHYQQKRSPEHYQQIIDAPHEARPLFEVTPGEREDWERGA